MKISPNLSNYIKKVRSIFKPVVKDQKTTNRFLIDKIKRIFSIFKFKLTHKPISFTPPVAKRKGKGFYYKGQEFIHHSDLPYQQSAFKTLIPDQKLILLLIAVTIITGFIFDWLFTAVIIIAGITIAYFVDLLLNLYLVFRGFTKNPQVKINEPELKKLADKKLPKYTILCPLYREWEVVPQFITAMSRLDYPKDKLQVMLLLEEDDKQTKEYIQKYQLPDYFEVVIVPHSLPKTKPKALNYGLKKARGEYIVVYDAEDIPDPDQLKKVILAFKKSSSDTVCMQAKLNFYNPKQNLLTRIFTAEYALWFDLVLTGLQSLYAPIPLGGTSNHFRTADLKKLKGWDSFNVTEDADLGMRLVKHGYHTAIINSDTLEEANSDVNNWFAQRTRWIKGYIQTYLVHTRDKNGFVKNNSHFKHLIFQIFIGGKVLFMFFNPLMWLTTIAYFAFRPITGPFIEQFFPGIILYLGTFSLVFGNFLYMYYYMIACVRRGQYDLVKYVYLIPFYWVFMSIAAWKAIIQLIRRPHFWPKTVHGFHYEDEKTMQQATEIIKKKLIARSFAPETGVANKSFNNEYFQPIPKKRSSGNFIYGIFRYLTVKAIFIGRNLIDLFDVLKFEPQKLKQEKRQKKRILIFNWRDTKHKFAGGAEVYTHELAKRWVKAGHMVTLFCGNDGHCMRNEAIDGVWIVRRGGFYTVYLWGFIYYLLKFRGNFDIIIDCENGIPFFTPLYAKEKKFLLIHHIHQEVFRKSLIAPMAGLAEFLELGLMPYVYRKVQIITVSPSSKKEIMDKRLTKIEPVIIYNGVDLDKFKPGVKSNSPLIIYIGRLQFYKSLHILIRSAKKILKFIPMARFVIAGFGEEKKGLMNLAKRIGVLDKIEFRGKVSEEEKVRLYQRSWVFVNPSMMEGFGITSIEANACGTPVVASDVPGLRDSVLNPHSGFLVPYGSVEEIAQKIELLIKDNNLRNEFSKRALEWAKNFDWQKSADKSMKLFNPPSRNSTLA
ncbi:hypothetical protein A2774_04475 [Candidatus Roizmanbacteria bacterium RIFCSPHIGHO2_01_FULL_39_12c]|uniref:Glycosyl transferase family 1 domain-containing protein n=1 Tax=Candidatus Roizmanbacteria bacterium RIFCSPHIGHO2_01_FULL_39_12c TaxID=1802031 RepID=A0A1F7G9C7_9BACT|nr:MAG: hypothetical protein A2774_04475 [Candidatus Roizmanbacteria bacterium RIFCSPHIGHO2_01_FULL_39_12c]OGK47779.1 MAG: hypothetical protein A2963_02895 [Candidatus Roizmanbacteria bacterium RIFCSPLOWO2_01_FULL_40_13]